MIDAKDEAVEVEVLQGGEVVRVIDTKTDRSIDIKAGEYDLRVKDSENGFRLSNGRVVLTRGDQEIVSVEKTSHATMEASKREVKSPPLFRNHLANSASAFNARENEQIVQAKNNLRKVILAVLNYDSAHGHFPAQGNRDNIGKPLLSWRVHVLPMMGDEESRLYDQFRLNEAWNSPHNIKLLSQMPEIYADPANQASRELGMTRIQSPIGKDLFMVPVSRLSKQQNEVRAREPRVGANGWPEINFQQPTETIRESGRKTSDIGDGLANTIAVIQLGASSAVHWTRPVDWNVNVEKIVDEMEAVLEGAEVPAIFATADGAIRQLRRPISKNVGRLFTRNDGRVVDWDRLTVPKTAEPHADDDSATSSKMIPLDQPIVQTDRSESPGSETSSSAVQNATPPARVAHPSPNLPGMITRMAEPEPAQPLYAGKTFDQWMDVVKIDRQLKAKFDALAAVAELAQGDGGRKEQVFDQIKPLLRKYGSNTISGGDPFEKELNGGTVKNTFRNDELTHLFIEILRRFSAKDLMELTIDEIRHGTANSRRFVPWLLNTSDMRKNDPSAHLKYFRTIERYSVKIATAVLETVKTCDAESGAAMSGIIDTLDGVVAMDLGTEVDSSMLEYVARKRPLGEMPDQWKLLLTTAFESNDLTQRGFVAVTMAKAFPNRQKLANDLLDLLADEKVSTQIRAAGLHALEELPLEKIEPIANRLLSVGKQSGRAKDRLIAWTKAHPYWPSNERLNINGSATLDADVRIGFLLSQLKAHDEELLPWLKELNAKALADPDGARFGRSIVMVVCTKAVLAQAIERVKGGSPEDRMAVQRDRRKKGFAPSKKPIKPFTKPTPHPVALYSGRTFDQWMDVVKNDRQLKTKFDALAAVAELAQGDDDRKKLVMDQITKLLRKYGSKVDGGSDLFKQKGPLKNTFRNYELTSAFIEILRRFPADDLMQLALDEIKDGTPESRAFLWFFWHPIDMKIRDPEAQVAYFSAIDQHAVEIGSALLETTKTWDAKNRSALFEVIERIDSAIGFDFDPESHPLEQIGWRKNFNSNKNLPSGWLPLITKAFESDQLTQRALVATTVSRRLPDRPQLAERLVELVEDKSLSPELRAAGLYGLDELSLEDIASIADRLLSVGKQTGPEKQRLITFTRNNDHFVRKQDNGAARVSNPLGVDVHIGFLLSRVNKPDKELLPWLEELRIQCKALFPALQRRFRCE